LLRQHEGVARDPRVIDPLLPYHVVSKGNNGGPLVWDDHDRRSFVRELARGATRYRWRVLAWCLMTNHYHVVVRTPADGFSAGFQQINGTHSRRTNRRHGRKDHLFKNRPFGVPIQSPAHLVGAILYVVRNPVTAELCQRAEAWSFSSYRATLGMESAPAWLAVDEVLALFGASPDRARESFAELVHRGRLLVSDTGVAATTV
jgi:putative transposase